MSDGDHAPRDRNGGYLLIEALATLAIGAVVLGGLLALGGTLSRSVDRAAWRVESGETGRRAVSAMASEIARAARRRFAGEGDRFVFLGAPDRIVFALEPVQANGLASTVAVAYQASRPGEALRAEAPLPFGAEGFDALDLSRPRTLDLGGETLRLAYVERSNLGDLITDTWEKPAAMPQAVRIDRVDRTGAVVASRRVALVAETEPGCAGGGGVAFCSTAPKGEEGGDGRRPPNDPRLQEPGRNRGAQDARSPR